MTEKEPQAAILGREVAAAEVDQYEAEIKLLDVQLEKTVIRGLKTSLG